MLDAMGDVVLQNLFLDPAQSGAHRRDLRGDVDAVAVFLDHFREATDLPIDPSVTFSDRRLDALAHADYIRPLGISCMARARKAGKPHRRIDTRRSDTPAAGSAANRPRSP